jgi:general L-amino acid transport system permease protein
MAGLALLLGAGAGLGGSIQRDLARLVAGALTVVLVLPLAAPLVALVAGPSLAELAAAFSGAAQWFLAGLVALGTGWLGARFAMHLASADPLSHARAQRLLRFAWLAALPAALIMLHGLGPSAVSSRDWGGLLLTLVLASISLALALPLGILLALGRRSGLPLVKVVSVLWIELVRGVPLVTVLFMASLMLPLVLPQDVRPEILVRAIAGFTVFMAAYIAEDVRGGLAALDQGQFEAAKAVGLGTIATYRLVILPQALRVVIPALVGQFISLFKDTSLVYIIGLRELTGIALAVVNQPEWLGLFREALLFVAAVYFLFSFVMSRTSRRLEDQLGVAAR